MAAEDIIIKMGLNTSAVAAGLRSVNRTVEGFASSVKASLKGAFSHLAAPLGAAGLIAGAHKVLEFADSLKTLSESLDISTDFLQTFRFAASENNSTMAKADAALSRLSIKIGQAKEGDAQANEVFKKHNITLGSTEEVVRQVADRMHQASGGTERAAIAMDFFGKGMTGIIPILKEGSAGLDEFSKKADKLSEQDIETISTFKNQLEHGWNRVLVAGGKALDVLLDYKDLLKSGEWKRYMQQGDGMFSTDYSGDMAAQDSPFAEKLAAQQRGFALKSEERQRDEIASKKAASELASQTAEKKIQALRHTGNMQYVTHLKGVMDAYQRMISSEVTLAKLKGDLALSKADRGKFTLEELAQQDTRGLNSFAAGQVRNAGLIQQLESQANLLRLKNPEESDRLRSIADRMRGGNTALTDSQRFPFKSLSEAIAKQTELVSEQTALFRTGEAKFQAFNAE